MTQPDFIPAAELARLTGLKLNSIWNCHQTGKGPLAEILVTLGTRRVGAWRADYEAWVASQRRLRGPDQDGAA